MHYLIQNRRPGNWGGFVTGVSHGTYCLGCCWVLMLLLFVGGVMNVFWIGALALVVLIEKVAPHGVWLGRVTGLALMAVGTVMLLSTIGS